MGGFGRLDKNRIATLLHKTIGTIIVTPFNLGIDGGANGGQSAHIGTLNHTLQQGHGVFRIPAISHIIAEIGVAAAGMGSGGNGVRRNRFVTPLQFIGEKQVGQLGTAVYPLPLITLPTLIHQIVKVQLSIFSCSLRNPISPNYSMC